MSIRKRTPTHCLQTYNYQNTVKIPKNTRKQSHNYHGVQKLYTWKSKNFSVWGGGGEKEKMGRGVRAREGGEGRVNFLKKGNSVTVFDNMYESKLNYLG